VVGFGGSVVTRQGWPFREYGNGAKWEANPKTKKKGGHWPKLLIVKQTQGNRMRRCRQTRGERSPPHYKRRAADTDATTKKAGPRTGPKNLLHFTEPDVSRGVGRSGPTKDKKRGAWKCKKSSSWKPSERFAWNQQRRPNAK